MPRHRWSFLAVLVAALVAFSSLAPALALADEHGGHGIDPADMDLAADPAEDFYRYANGGWLDRAEIPADQGSYGVFEELNDLTTEQLLALLDRLSTGGELQEGSDAWKAVQLFAQARDLDTRNAQGVAPIQATLDEIDAIADLDALHRFLLDSRFKGVWGLFSLDVYSDLEDSTIWAPYLFGPELWLPNRDYYLEDDPSFEEIRPAYVETLAKLLVYAGHDEAAAPAAAQAVYDLEKRLAAETLTREQQQDFSLMNNRTTVEQLEQMYPLLDWAGYMDALGLPNVDELIAAEVKYLEALGPIVQETPLSALKDMLKLQLLWTHRIYLDDAIQTISFDFRGRVLSGSQELPPIEERALDTVNEVLGEALGQLYVAEHFPPEAKAQIEELVDQLILAFGQRLEANAWMSDSAKAEALDKLSKIIVKVGYPDRWRSYDQVQITDSLAATVRSAFNAEYERMLARVGQPVDKTEWFFPPQVVNAFYDPADNSITFPAGILQPPFFDYQADPASNFGAIGFVIGHEITHGYDLQGSQFDADGNLNSWWTEEDAASFDALNQRVVEQYGAIEVLPELFINGQITVTENVADLGGLQVAQDALESYLATNPSPLPPPPGSGPALGLTQEQRFFVAAATVWREKISDELLTTLVQSDPHSPGSARGTLPLRNMDEFHEAFGIQPGDAMYLPPEERVLIW